MLEGLEGFCGIEPLVIGVTIETRTCGKSPVEDRSGGVSRQQFAGRVPDTDIALFVAADALDRTRAAEWLVAAHAIFFQMPMSLHQRSGIEKQIRKNKGHGCKNDDKGDENNQ